MFYLVPMDSIASMTIVLRSQGRAGTGSYYEKHVALSLPKGLRCSISTRLRVPKSVRGMGIRFFGCAQNDSDHIAIASA